MNDQEIALWQELADLTNAKCQQTCHNMGQCCNTIYCEQAAENMREAGHEFPLMPFGKTFVVDGKCIVPAHFRPICVLQQCKVNSMGFDSKDPEWTKKYFAIRDKLEEMAIDREWVF